MRPQLHEASVGERIAIGGLKGKRICWLANQLEQCTVRGDFFEVPPANLITFTCEWLIRLTSSAWEQGRFELAHLVHWEGVPESWGFIFVQESDDPGVVQTL